MTDTIFDTPYPPIYKPPTFVPLYKIPKPKPVDFIFKPTPTPVFKLPEFKYKKKKTIDPFKQFFKGYRERTWKVPSMKDFMNGGVF